jgi:pimeloyl-ACP methyl ester carboxylesterase
MPVMKIGDGEIYYEEFGAGDPVLCFAPGSLTSQIDFWHRSPRYPDKPAPWFDPTVDLKSDFRIIAMDQRNSGRSRAPLRPTDDWETYADDHIALLDHLGIERAHVLGACIGATFGLKLCERAPDRIASAVLLQPIGRVPENISYTKTQFEENWGPALCKVNPDIDPALLSGFGERLFGKDFVHSVTREFVAGCQIQMLIMPGNEVAHPVAVAEELLRLAPRAEYLKYWKGEGRAYAARCAIDFLRRNAPAKAH